MGACWRTGRITRSSADSPVAVDAHVSDTNGARAVGRRKRKDETKTDMTPSEKRACPDQPDDTILMDLEDGEYKKVAHAQAYRIAVASYHEKGESTARGELLSSQRGAHGLPAHVRRPQRGRRSCAGIRRTDNHGEPHRRPFGGVGGIATPSREPCAALLFTPVKRQILQADVELRSRNSQTSSRSASAPSSTTLSGTSASRTPRFPLSRRSFLRAAGSSPPSSTRRATRERPSQCASRGASTTGRTRTESTSSQSSHLFHQATTSLPSSRLRPAPRGEDAADCGVIASIILSSRRAVG